MSVKYVCNETQFKITNLFFFVQWKKTFSGNRNNTFSLCHQIFFLLTKFIRVKK